MKDISQYNQIFNWARERINDGMYFYQIFYDKTVYTFWSIYGKPINKHLEYIKAKGYNIWKNNIIEYECPDASSYITKYNRSVSDEDKLINNWQKINFDGYTFFLSKDKIIKVVCITNGQCIHFSNNTTMNECKKQLCTILEPYVNINDIKWRNFLNQYFS